MSIVVAARIDGIMPRHDAVRVALAVAFPRIWTVHPEASSPVERVQDHVVNRQNQCDPLLRALRNESTHFVPSGHLKSLIRLNLAGLLFVVVSPGFVAELSPM